MRFALRLRQPKTDDSETGVATTRYVALSVPLQGSATGTSLDRRLASITARVTDATLASLDLNASVTSRTTRGALSWLT